MLHLQLQTKNANTASRFSRPHSTSGDEGGLHQSIVCVVSVLVMLNKQLEVQAEVDAGLEGVGTLGEVAGASGG